MQEDGKPTKPPSPPYSGLESGPLLSPFLNYLPDLEHDLEAQLARECGTSERTIRHTQLWSAQDTVHRIYRAIRNPESHRMPTYPKPFKRRIPKGLTSEETHQSPVAFDLAKAYNRPRTMGGHGFHRSLSKYQNKPYTALQGLYTKPGKFPPPAKGRDEILANRIKPNRLVPEGTYNRHRLGTAYSRSSGRGGRDMWGFDYGDHVDYPALTHNAMHIKYDLAADFAQEMEENFMFGARALNELGATQRKVRTTRVISPNGKTIVT